MTETTVTQPAQPQLIQISPIAMANEARAMNDFLTDRSLRNANDVVMLMGKIRELEAQIADQSKAYADEVDRITKERDETVQRLASANAKIIEIQNAQASPVSRSKVKTNG
ncbi:hypothetical protein [Ochrobactrum sp. EDr1-4]|uniref:hypothetical protein n=1 Tax=Ochrobactrum sp. EDr1-4 TaxID=3368622 RepID=UPI003BA15BED